MNGNKHQHAYCALSVCHAQEGDVDRFKEKGEEKNGSSSSGFYLLRLLKFLGALGLVIGMTVSAPTSATGVVYVDKNATGANNGNSWDNAYTTIQEGIDDADVADEEVWVAKGTYWEAIVMKSGVKLYGGFNGTETLRSQRDWTTNVTRIDGSTARDGSPAYHVVTMDSIVFCAIDGFTITGGYTILSLADALGAGIYCDYLDNTSTIANNTISGNTAHLAGGGIYCRFSSPIITNNMIMGNSATTYTGGGGIYCNQSSPIITNNTIAGNSAEPVGGGIYCILCSPTISNNTITGNSAPSGGGIYCYYNSAPTITNNTVSGNSANNYGGGIYCYYNSAPTITNNTISGNSATVGGGISCDSSAPTITNNTIAGNSVPSYGGGIFCLNSSPGIKNTIFSNNNNYDIYEFDTSSDPLVSYNDFYGNTDGVYYDEGVTPYTSVSAMDAALAECTNNIGFDPLFVGDTLSGGTWSAEADYNPATFQTTLTDSFTSWTASEHAGRLLNPDTSQNKQFIIVSNTATTINVWGDVSPIAHIGDTYKIYDYHLQSASPCIDAGCNIPGLTQDFEGDPRPYDGTSETRGDGSDFDIGADEFIGTGPPPTPTPTPTPAPPNTPTGLQAKGGADSILLTWNPNSEPDLDGYNVYRYDNSTESFIKLNTELVKENSYIDTDVESGKTYYYKITAMDTEGLESPKTEAVSADTGSIIVTMPDYRGAPDTYVLMKINCAYATGITGNGMDIRLTYDEDILTPIEVQKTVLTQDFTFVDNISVADGQINISGVSAEGATIKGEGHILNIKFHVPATAELLTTGTHTFVLVKMYDAVLRPLNVDYSDTAVFTVAPDYILGDVTGDGVIDSADALMALQAALGQRELSQLEFNAADVNGDGVVDSADVTLILRLAVGLPVNPAEKSFEYSRSDLFHEGIVMSSYESSYLAFISHYQAVPGQTIYIPVELDKVNGIASFEVFVNYNWQILQLKNITKTALTDGFVLNCSTSLGVVRLALASAQALNTGSGGIALMEFEVIGSLGESSPLCIAKLKLSGEYGDDLSWSTLVTRSNGALNIALSTSAELWQFYE